MTMFDPSFTDDYDDFVHIHSDLLKHYHTPD